MPEFFAFKIIKKCYLKMTINYCFVISLLIHSYNSILILFSYILSDFATFRVIILLELEFAKAEI